LEGWYSGTKTLELKESIFLDVFYFSTAVFFVYIFLKPAVYCLKSLIQTLFLSSAVLAEQQENNFGHAS
jgi:hypothetical protein